MSYSAPYRFYLSSRLGDDYLSNPADISKVKEVYQREKEARLGYKRTLVGKLTFVGEDFDWLYELETSTFRCDSVTLEVQKKCGSVWSSWFVGRLLLNSGDWDIDACKVELDIETVDKYTCLEDNGDTEYNAFELTPTRTTVATFPGTLETTTCDIETTCPVTGDGWTFYQRDYAYDIGDVLTGTDYYARYNLGGGIYKAAVVYDFFNIVYSDIAGSYGYKVLGIDSEDIDNGIPLDALLEALVAEICPVLSVQSDFFQINPANVSSTNYVTGEATKVDNIVLFQKSDVKRAGAAENATIAPITFNDLMQFLYVTFQVKYYVDDNNKLIIEHVSYLDEEDGLDLTTADYARYVFHKNKYSYSRDKMPRYERFRLMEAVNADFVGLPITYEDSCVIRSGPGSEKIYESDQFTTDILFVIDNPDSDSGLVSDEGFAVVACDSSDAILSEDGILDIERLNNTLGYAQLHRDYWQHQRVLLVGNMNGVETTFLSALRVRKQTRVRVPLCCGDEYSPTDLQKTAMGWGEVDRSEFNLLSGMLELDLLHEVPTQYRISCPTIALSSTKTSISYGFEPLDVATGYVVRLYKEGVLVATNTHTGPWAGDISDSFTGLDVAATYTLNVEVQNSEEDYSRVCGTLQTDTLDLTCPTAEVDALAVVVYLNLSGIDAEADEVEIRLYQGLTLIESVTDTAPVADPWNYAKSGLTPGTEYTFRTYVRAGAYTKECGPYAVTTVTPVSYELRLSAGENAECSADNLTYYSDDASFGTGTSIYTNADLTILATGFDFAVDEFGTVWNMVDGVITTPTGDSC